MDSIEVIVRNDRLENNDGMAPYYIPAGGVYQREDGAPFNVRIVELQPDAATAEGIFANGKAAIPVGFVFLDCAAAMPLVGKRLRLTLEEVE